MESKPNGSRRGLRTIPKAPQAQRFSATGPSPRLRLVQLALRDRQARRVSNIDSTYEDKQGPTESELEPPDSILWGSLKHDLEAQRLSLIHI